jgi:phospholipid/cholesterol/gamma-HCH transport system substrate-binding protein
MPRRASWTELTVGLIALAVLACVGFGVLVFARIGQLHGDTFRLYALTGEARGVIRGSEVWLAGQKVGVVKDIAFMAPTSSASSRILIAMDVLSSARQGIRRNSTAQVRAGGTPIGAPVVYVTIGTNTAPVVSAGDTIRTLPQSDLETMSSEFAIASREFPAILGNIKLLNQQLHSVQGTLGAFGIEHGGVQLTTAQAHLSQLATTLNQPNGTVGLALSSRPSLAARAQLAMARADSLRALLNSDRSSYGRFRRDSSLLNVVSDIRGELNIVQARMSSTSGTLGRARADSALLDAIASTQREMTLMMADVRRRPLRYVHF